MSLTKFLSSSSLNRRNFATIVPDLLHTLQMSSAESQDVQAKYAEKVKQKLQEMGIKDVEQFRIQQEQRRRQMHANVFSAMRREGDKMDPLKIPATPTAPNSMRSYATLSDRGKSLDSILKMELLQDADTETISTVWKEYHREKEMLCAVIPVETYEKMMDRGANYPIFLLPVPKGDQGGVEFYVLQFTPPNILFTSLGEYQRLGPHGARPWLRLQHFTELQDKGIVLMRGEVEPDVLNRGLSLKEAQWLALSLQTYYVNPSPRKEELLDAFKNRPSEFDHVKLIDEMDKLE